MYKGLTLENWLEEENIIKSRSAATLIVIVGPKTAFGLQFGEAVPERLRDLFGVARGRVALRVLLLSDVHSGA
jgi:hypothetical protein